MFYNLTPEENQRRFERQSRSLVAQIKLSDSDDALWDIITVREISASGILFTCSRDEVKKGMRMQLKLNFPAAKKPLDMDIMIVRLEPQQTANVDFIGAQFVRIRDEDRPIIDNFIRETNRTKEEQKKLK